MELYGVHMEDYKTEEEYEEIFEEKIKILNAYDFLGEDYEFSTDYAYGGVRLTKRRKNTGGESDLSPRYYYDDEDTDTQDYDAFLDMLNTMINVLREIKNSNEER